MRHDFHNPHEHHSAGGFGRGFGPGGFPGMPGFGPRGFGPGGPQRKRRGDVRLAILSLLSDKPSNGYGLIKEIGERSNGAWTPSPGSVYPTLQQLVDEDLIEAVGEGRRTEFQLTDAGKAYVAENADALAAVWASGEADAQAHGQLGESVGKLMGVVAQFRFAATDEQRTAAVAKLDETRRALYAILAD